MDTPSPGKTPRILCVDDEPNVLEGLRRALGRGFEVVTASSGAEGLAVLARDAPFAAVLSDLRMPGMDGAAFLAEVRIRAPDTARVLLTGQADLASAIAAVNQGGIFSLLTKPCAREVLRETLLDAVAQHERTRRAQSAARVLALSQELADVEVEEQVWESLVFGVRRLLDAQWCLGFRWETGRRALRLQAVSGAEPFESLVGTAVPLASHPALRDAFDQPGPAVRRGAPIGARLPGFEKHFAEPWVSMRVSRGEWIGGWLAAGPAPPGGTDPLASAWTLVQQAGRVVRHLRLTAERAGADQAAANIAANISHELRTPLIAILGYTDLLHSGDAGPLTEEQHALLERVQKRGRELRTIVDGTLCARELLVGGGPVPAPSSITLGELAAQIALATSDLETPRDVGLERHVAGDPSALLFVDEGDVARVVRQLLANAFKFTASGHVAIRLGVEGSSLLIEVCDTGVGIPPEHFDGLFEFFRQGDGSSTRRFGGLGLGLYIVRKTVDRLGGTITVESTPGQGSTFRVRVPASATTVRKAG